MKESLQDYNYHTHTFRCGHAVGDVEDYIKSALKNGFKTLGFSDHIGFDDWSVPRVRMEIFEMPEYENTVKNLREKYKDEIEIKLGYEAEYYPDKKDYYFEVRNRVDYMILGQHTLKREPRYLDENVSDFEVREIGDRVTEAIETGIFMCVAHPDYFMLGRKTYSKDCDRAIRQIAKTAKKFGVFMELNLKGYYEEKREIDGEIQSAYPFRKAMESIFDEGAKFMIGYDEHDPKVFDFRDRELEFRKNVKDLLR